MSTKRYRINLAVTYIVSMSVPAEDEEQALIEIEKYLAKCDDYDIVNRSEDRQVKIEKIDREYQNS